jgi:hypothetical protein
MLHLVSIGPQIASRHRDIGPPGSQLLDDRPADPHRPAGHEGDLTL